MKTFSIVVAVENSNGIGLKGGMPWPRLSKDMAHFQKVTSTTNCGEGDSYNKNIRNAIIMGRKTWDSIPSHLRPLKNRLNIILTHNKELLQERQENEIWAASLQSALDTVQNDKSIDKIFVIGGGQLYREAMKHVLCENLYITRIYADFEYDTTFPLIRPEQFREEFFSGSAHSEHDIQYQFKLYKRLPPVHEEYQYLDMIREVITSGNDKSDRTGVGTISVFGRQMRFSLRNGSFPLLTTKRVFWRGVAEELLWFVAGTTNGKLLQEKKIHIWDGNGSRQYLNCIGLRDREEMDLGPVYGFQWRHWGAKYENMHTDYTNRGIDQLAECIHKIKNNPTDRRIIMTAWNPSDLKEMALPPCHMFCQFYVADGELSCQMYQRSCDMGLGVPFNIASYSLLTYMVAHVCGLKPGEFVHVLGDTHVYKNHVKPLEEQLTRKPRPFPTLKITRNVTSIDDFKFEDFELTGYDCHGPIKMDMAV